MLQASDILGMNAREMLFTKLNSSHARKYTVSKLAAKKLLKSHGIAVPELYARFTEFEKVKDFDFTKISSSFVIKPSGGNAGKGILIIKKRISEQSLWIGVKGERISETDIKLHISDILEGQYSTYGTHHSAFVEERVTVHSTFKKYVYKGTPDIRVIVYNSIPVMSMLRLPTQESEGRANLHQGAVGVGIDIASGVTLKGVKNNRVITTIDGTKRKLNGIRIPQWTLILKTAVKAAEVAGLRYCGVDLFVHPEKGPMVVELNANPGLGIQVANQDGLRKRLERVEGLQIRDEAHGVKVGKALFAEWFADKVKAEDGTTIIDTFEKIQVRSSKKKWTSVQAKIDTGAFRSAVDKGLARNIGLLAEENFLWESSVIKKGKSEKKKVVEVVLLVKGRKIRTGINVLNLSRSKYKIILGRKDLAGFLINPQLTANT